MQSKSTGNQNRAQRRRRGDFQRWLKLAVYERFEERFATADNPYSADARAVAWALLQYVNWREKSPSCFPSRDTLARSAKIGSKRVTAAIQELASPRDPRWQLLHVKRRPNGSNIYVLVADAAKFVSERTAAIQGKHPRQPALALGESEPVQLDLCEQVCARIEQQGQVKRFDLRTWIRPLEMRRERSQVVIAATDPTVLSHAAKHYRVPIERAVRELCNTSVLFLTSTDHAVAS